MDTYELTILMPCLNEAETLAQCIQKAKTFLQNASIQGEILIADNGSTDGSQIIAERYGARLIHVATRGYGAALKSGMKEARGRYVIMGDADDSYDFLNLMPFLHELRAGYDLVMGNRFRGGIIDNAMPFLNRYLGNPVLSFIGRIFFKSHLGDFHCGLRGFRRDRMQQLNLQGDGMEFASEMIIKATLNQFNIIEVPTQLFPDGRKRRPHLRPWRDGWRHLRLLLLFSPRWLFLYPSLTLISLGLMLMTLLAINPIQIGKINLDIHSMLCSALFIIIGLQGVSFAIFAKFIANTHLTIPAHSNLSRLLNYFTLERGLLTGSSFVLIGALGIAYVIWYWFQDAFGPLAPSSIMRILIPAATSVICGMQLIFSSFFMSLLKLHCKDFATHLTKD